MSVINVVKGWFHSRNNKNCNSYVGLKEVTIEPYTDDRGGDCVELILWSKNKSTTRHKNVIALSKEDARKLWEALTPLVTYPVPTEEPHTCCRESESVNECIHRVCEDSECVDTISEEKWILKEGTTNVWTKVGG